ncbi:hypothetical protein TNCT_225381, partial [Trichonephila clavata]
MYKKPKQVKMSAKDKRGGNL